MLFVIIKGSNAGRDFPLNNIGRVIIGRGKDCDITILDLLVSRRHCKVEKRGNNYFIDDLQSTNKTTLNGRFIEKEEKLNVGDLVKIGDTVLLFTDKKNIDIKSVLDFDLLIKGQTRIVKPPSD